MPPPPPSVTIFVKHDASSSSVEDTLAWVRRSAAERRKRYRDRCAQREEDNDATEALARGRSVVASAEAQLKRFEECFFDTRRKDDEEEKEEEGGNAVEEKENKEQDQASNEAPFPERLARRLDETVSTTRTCDDEDSNASRRETEEEETRVAFDDEEDREVARATDFLRDLKLRAGRKYAMTSMVYDKIDSIMDKGRRTANTMDIMNESNLEKDEFDNDDNYNENDDNHDLPPRLAHKETLERILSEPNAVATVHRTTTTTTKTTTSSVTRPVFDPNSLECAKRSAAALAARGTEKRHDGEGATASLFRARPLPGGVWVPNDPYALTRTAASRLRASVATTTNMRGHERRCVARSENDDPATTTKDEDPQNLIKEEGGEEKTTPCWSDVELDYLKRLYRDRVRESVTAHKEAEARFFREHKEKRDDVPGDKGNESDDDADDDDMGEANATEKANSLEREITKLEVQLEKRTRHVDFLRRLCRLTVEFDVEPFMRGGDDHNDDEDDRRWEPPRDALSDDAVYRRQESWRVSVERRREEIRERLAASVDVRETANRGNHHHRSTDSAESWERAKTEHERSVRACRERENRRRDEREARVARSRELQAKETAVMRDEAMARRRRSKTTRLEAERQRTAADKLSRPKTKRLEGDEGTVQAKTRISPVKEEEEEMAAAARDDGREYTENQTTSSPLRESCRTKETTSTTKRKKPGASRRARNGATKTEPTINFGDLDDDEFERMLRKMGIDPRIDKKVGPISLPGLEPKPEGSPGTDNDEGDDYEFKNDDAETNTIKLVNDVERKILEKRREHVLSVVSLATATTKSDDRHNDDDDDRSMFSFMRSSVRAEEEECNREPYQRYEAGRVPFFDRSSSTDKGRFRVRDARGFAPETMKRRPYDDDQSGSRDDGEGVTLLVGRKINDNDDYDDEEKEVTITIMFDRTLFDETSAAQWWEEHRSRFV